MPADNTYPPSPILPVHVSLHICVVGTEFQVLHCTFWASPAPYLLPILSLRSDQPLSHGTYMDGPTRPRHWMNATLPQLLTFDTSPSLTAISFLPPSRPATSPFNSMQPRPSRTASLAPRYVPPCGPQSRSSRPSRSPNSSAGKHADSMHIILKKSRACLPRQSRELW
jgi:hypothetical protein